MRDAAQKEAWKYTSARDLLAGVPADVAAPADETDGGATDPDRAAWGLSRVLSALVAGVVGEGGVGGSDVSGVSGARRRWEVPAGERTWVQHLRGSGTHLSEDVVVVGPGASARHVRVVDLDGDAHHAGLVAVQLAEGARYELVSVIGGGRMVRVDVAVRFEGPDARAELSGLTVVAGDRHADHHLTIHHEAPRCTSVQDFRALVDDRAVSVFTGKVVVRRGAEGADAAQLHRALLLSDAATAKARPQLEIHTDEVKASHGTAVGALDPEALFYLRQRGLDPSEARALLVEGFAAAVLDKVPEPHRADLGAALPRWRS